MVTQELIATGHELMDKGSVAKAALVYQSALNAAPSSRSAMIGRAAAAILMRDLDTARSLLSRVQGESLDDPDDRRRYAFWLAYLEAEQGNGASALQLADDWLSKVNPLGQVRLQTLAARTLFQMKALAQGQERIRKAAELTDEADQPTMMWLANIAFMLHEYTVATNASRGAIRLRATPALLFLHAYSRWYRLNPAIRIVCALGVAALMFIPAWGGYVALGLLVVTALAALLGFRARLGGLVGAAVATGGGILAAYLLFRLYLVLT